jgi:two-component system sensor histidine kinase BaeS
MSGPSVVVPARPAQPLLDTVFGSVWPEESLPARPRLVLAAVVTGLLAAAVVPFRGPGIGTFLVLMTVCGVVAAADGRLRSTYHLVSGVVCTLLLSSLFVRDAQWVVALCLLAAFGVGSVALAEGRSAAGVVAAGAAVPLAALRGLPWLGRSLAVSSRSRAWLPLVRTVVISVLLVVVFGSLFASADALFARWAGALVPDLAVGSLVLRAVVLAACAGLTLAGAYVGLNPPQVERLAPPAGSPVARRFEWLVPVSLVVLVFALFVIAQLTAMFGGHGYVRRTTGLTYADYVHQGFAQLTVVTLLTLGVVATAVRKAPRGTAPDRLLLRAVLGVLCGLTLLVVASALYRIHVYEQAYGFTRLRLLVSFFEGWLGLVVVLVVAAGVRLRGTWAPRAVVLTGAVTLLAMAALNPDGYIAQRNVDRYQHTGKADWDYLSGLSADAVPVLAGLPSDGPLCVPAARTGDWLEWNLGRVRAADLVPVPPRPGCRR